MLYEAGTEQWRIQDFPEEGALTPNGGVPTYYLANFSRKLHENEEIWGQGGRASLAPPLRSATAECGYVNYKPLQEILGVSERKVYLGTLPKGLLEGKHI